MVLNRILFIAMKVRQVVVNEQIESIALRDAILSKIN